MARRAPVDEQPYRPLLDASIISSALSHKMPAVTQASAAPAAPQPVQAQTKVVEMVRPEPTKAVQAPPVLLTQPLVEKFDQEKRVLFTRSESQAIERLVTSLAARVHAQVKVSHVMRALVALLLNAEPEIDRRAGEAGALIRPPNGDPKALQRFEKDIARILASAMRDAGPMGE